MLIQDPLLNGTFPKTLARNLPSAGMVHLGDRPDVRAPAGSASVIAIPARQSRVSMVALGPDQEDH